MKAKRQILIFLSFVLSMSFVVLSCADEKDEYVCPEFGELVQEPNPAKAGEDVTLTFTQTKKGNGIAGTTYTWTIRNVEPDEETGTLKDMVLSVHTNYDGYDKQAPTITFKVPESCSSGTYMVDMDADFSCYIAPVLFDKTNAHGRLRIQ